MLAKIDSVHGDGPLAAIPINHKPGKGALGSFTHYKGGKAINIAYKVKSKNYKLHPELTMAHEIGHWLDHSGTPGMDFSSNISGGAFDNVIKAAKSTNACTALAAMPPSKARTYYLSNHEVFARAYAQFIAEETGDATMLQQVADIRADVMPDRHWETPDFAPVRTEMRKAFVKLGWMKEVQP